MAVGALAMRRPAGVQIRNFGNFSLVCSIPGGSTGVPSFMASIENAAGPDAWFKIEQGVFKAGGEWTIAQSARLDRQLRDLDAGPGETIAMDAASVERLDSTGAWLLLRTRRALEKAGRTV